MTTINAHLGSRELEARYEAAAESIAKSHFSCALWLLSQALQRGWARTARRPARL
jgi:hypothetical protein